MIALLPDLIPGAAALKFPEFSPAPFSVDLGFLGLGEFHLRWYALAYIGGIALAWWYASALLKRPALFGAANPPMTRLQLDDIMFWIILGIILGGRLGYLLFYVLPHEPQLLANDPMMIVRVWDGGMAFHGGILGVVLALVYFARRHKLSLLAIGDIAGLVAPIGIALGRFANFINAELYGRPTSSSWGMIFPEGYVPGSTPPAYDFEANKWIYSGLELPRYPSQLFEATLEGVLPLVFLSILIWQFKALHKPGLVAGIFLMLYGFGRTVVENFREPDAFVEGLPGWLTMGQLLSIPMWIGGAYLIWNALKKPAA